MQFGKTATAILWKKNKCEDRQNLFKRPTQNLSQNIHVSNVDYKN